MLHAYNHDSNRLAAVRDAVREEWPRATIHVPPLPASLFSLADPDEIVAGVLGQVDDFVTASGSAGEPFARIVLVGHSLGALLARKLYVVACGETGRAPFEAVYRRTSVLDEGGRVAARDWAPLVERVILFAGMNRGWRVSHHLSLRHAPFWALGSVACRLIRLFSGRWPLIFRIRRGAEFITQLRIQWLAMRHRSGASPGDPASTAAGAITIQLLGSRDDMVAPEDNVDLVSGKQFYYFDVPYSGHSDVIELDDPVAGPGRSEIFRFVLTASAEDLGERDVVPSDESFDEPDQRVRNVLFVIHGIRDRGYWTHKIARRVRQYAAHQSEWATVTSSYGYFPMLPFLLGGYRRTKVEWLMDRYTEAMARYPNATLHYVGHSNGTYLLARAMELYECCRFGNVVFAGSVVRRNYDWRRLLQPPSRRVGAVLNFVASGDWVVAFFPKLFQWLRISDLGSAGHDGFLTTQDTPGVHQIRHVEGGHGAAIDERVWDAIAEFILTGKVAVAPTMPPLVERSFLVRLFGYFPPFVWLLAAALLVLLWLAFEGLLSGLVTDDQTRQFLRGFSLAAYLLLLWVVLTRL